VTGTPGQQTASRGTLGGPPLPRVHGMLKAAPAAVVAATATRMGCMLACVCVWWGGARLIVSTPGPTAAAAHLQSQRLLLRVGPQGHERLRHWDARPLHKLNHLGACRGGGEEMRNGRRCASACWRVCWREAGRVGGGGGARPPPRGAHHGGHAARPRATGYTGCPPIPVNIHPPPPPTHTHHPTDPHQPESTQPPPT
jgi:hypothetical protein